MKPLPLLKDDELREVDLSSYPRFLDETQVADSLNVSIALVRKWRGRKTGPKALKIGGRLVRYELDSVLAFARQDSEECE